MDAEHRAPTRRQVILAIARREIRIARRRRLVKLLFLGSLLPPLVMGVILVIRILVEGAGITFPWDPLAGFIMIQAGPVLFLALAIGTPSIARDRGEDVLFLYATRPVTPWSYTLGKLAAVAIPACALLLIPGALIATLRMGLLDEVGASVAFGLLAKLTVVAVFMAVAYAGLCVGASAATKKARWALLLAFGALMMTQAITGILRWRNEYALDAPGAVKILIDRLFEGWDAGGVVAILVLITWGVVGASVTAARVRQEMTP